jgi:hypothetical protein
MPRAVPDTSLAPSLTLAPGLGFTNLDGGRGIFPELCVEIDVTNAPTNSTRVWTDITADVRQLRYTVGGRNDELQQSQPGSLTVILANRDSKYDPSNGSGIGVKRRQWIRVRAAWNGTVYPRWQGIISVIDQAWPEAGIDGIATITAADAMKVANLYDLKGQTFSSQQSDARVSAVAALLGLATNILDSGASTLVAVGTAFGVGSPAATHLTDVETTENGLVYANMSGQIEFQSRHYRPLNEATPVATIGDNAGEIPYKESSHVVSDDAYISSVAYVTPTNSDGSTGTPQTATSSTSSTEYFPSTPANAQRTILSSDTNEALNCAEYIVNKYGDPSPRVPAVELGIRKSQWDIVLAATNSTRFTFKRRAANTFAEDVFVEQISEEIVPGSSWKTMFQLSPATDQAMWILGDSVNGVLGSTTRPGY